MTFYQSYLIEYSRVITGIVLENRQSIPQIKGKGSWETKSFIDAQINMVTTDVIPYKIETAAGNLVAYFSLLVTGSKAVKYQLFIRNNFTPFSTEISQFIDNFIVSNEWTIDILQGELRD